MDPYRTSDTVGSCPRCANTLEAEGGRLACPAGCGEWYSREDIERVVAWHDLDRAPRATPSPWPWQPAGCPICRADMVIGYRGDVRFDRCSAHGVWLDAGEYERLRML